VADGATKRLPEVFGSREDPWLLATVGHQDLMSLFCADERGWMALGKGPDTDFELATSKTESREFLDIELRGERGRISRQRGGGPVSNLRYFGPAILLRLDVRCLSAPSYSEEPVPRIEPDGKGLASVLAYLSGNRPEDYERLLEALQRVVPMVRAMRFPRAEIMEPVEEVVTIDGKTFTRSGKRALWGNSIEFDMEGAPRIPARMTSEGTLLVLGLLTALMGPEQPRLVLLDDLDRALHPKAQEDLVVLLRKLLDQHPEMQIVATSHSPYLLHHLLPEEVLLTALRKDGSVVCGRLDEHPQFERWKDEMTPGELWSLFGERWLVEADAGEEG